MNFQRLQALHAMFSQFLPLVRVLNVFLTLLETSVTIVEAH
jgi:hypothetical protein